MTTTSHLAVFAAGCFTRLHKGNAKFHKGNATLLKARAMFHKDLCVGFVIRRYGERSETISARHLYVFAMPFHAEAAEPGAENAEVFLNELAKALRPLRLA